MQIEIWDRFDYTRIDSASADRRFLLHAFGSAAALSRKGAARLRVSLPWNQSRGFQLCYALRAFAL